MSEFVIFACPLMSSHTITVFLVSSIPRCTALSAISKNVLVRNSKTSFSWAGYRDSTSIAGGFLQLTCVVLVEVFFSAHTSALFILLDKFCLEFCAFTKRLNEAPQTHNVDAVWRQSVCVSLSVCCCFLSFIQSSLLCSKEFKIDWKAISNMTYWSFTSLQSSCLICCILSRILFILDHHPPPFLVSLTLYCIFSACFLWCKINKSRFWAPAWCHRKPTVLPRLFKTDCWKGRLWQKYGVYSKICIQAKFKI